MFCDNLGVKGQYDDRRRLAKFSLVFDPVAPPFSNEFSAVPIASEGRNRATTPSAGRHIAMTILSVARP
jgi:hypothetical protein